PGRDPRPAFKTAAFADGVEELKDLTPGMILEGVVTNVAGFGAFVDIGVHQDGLVHVSALSHTFVKDPREVVKPRDIVRVKVLDGDLPRKRISLTLRLEDEATPGGRTERPPRQERPSGGPRQDGAGRPQQRGGGGRDRDRNRDRDGGSGGSSFGGGALADALRRAGLDKGLDGRPTKKKPQR